MRNQRITEEKAKEFYTRFETPEHVIGHCRGVARTAVCIAEALNKAGFKLDMPLIYGSAIVHDMARVMEDHQTVAAEFLRRQGYDDEADIVSQHMTYNFKNTDVEEITELDIVCLADRLVKDDRYVGLDERMDYIIKKAKTFNPGAMGEEIEKHILEKKKITKELMDNIENKIGASIDDLMEE